MIFFARHWPWFFSQVWHSSLKFPQCEQLPNATTQKYNCCFSFTGQTNWNTKIWRFESTVNKKGCQMSNEKKGRQLSVVWNLARLKGADQKADCAFLFEATGFLMNLWGCKPSALSFYPRSFVCSEIPRGLSPGFWAAWKLCKVPFRGSGGWVPTKLLISSVSRFFVAWGGLEKERGWVNLEAVSSQMKVLIFIW